jgi:hypothetical protein
MTNHKNREGKVEAKAIVNCAVCLIASWLLREGDKASDQTGGPDEAENNAEEEDQAGQC